MASHPKRTKVLEDHGNRVISMYFHPYGHTCSPQAWTSRSENAATDLRGFESGLRATHDLHIDGGAQNVWASTAANDVIGFTGIDDNMRFGENPANPGFGGRVLTSDDGSLSPVATHSEYWDQGNESRKNIARIVTGKAAGVN